MPFGWGRGFGRGFGWGGNPYVCARFPWLPRWWWAGMYGPITPFTTALGTSYTPYYAPPYSTYGTPAAAMPSMMYSPYATSPYSTYGTPATAMPSMTYSPYATSPYSIGAEIPQIPKEQERQMLEGQATALQQQLDQIKKRLEEISKM